MNGSRQQHVLRALNELQKIQVIVSDLMESRRYDSFDIHHVTLAMEESLTNALRHGNQLDPTKEVRVEFSVRDEDVWIEIEDQGDGFRTDDVPDPTLPENLTRANGRGVYLIRTMMSSVEYNDRGNRVTMRKVRTGR